MKTTASQGFSLTELMVTVSIVAVLMVLATPNFQQLVLNNRRTVQTNEFVLALAYAKSEAVKRGVRVSVCARATDSTCSGGIDWSNGWLVFVDNPPAPYGTVNDADAVLQVHPPLASTFTLQASARFSVTFQSTGFIALQNDGASSVGNDTFNLCDSRGDAYCSHIALYLQGWLCTQQPGGAACP